MYFIEIKGNLNNKEYCKEDEKNIDNQKLICEQKEIDKEINKDDTNTSNYNKKKEDSNQILEIQENLICNNEKIEKNLSHVFYEKEISKNMGQINSNQKKNIDHKETYTPKIESNNNKTSYKNDDIDKNEKNNDSLKIPIMKKDSIGSNYPIRESKLLIQEKIQENLNENIIYQSLKFRFLEYSAAINYFRDHYLSKLENDAISKAYLCQKYIKALENGYEIDESKIPLGITPEYINDCSKKERIDRYTKLIKEFNKNKIDLVNKRNKILKDFNLMHKKDQLKKQDEIKAEIIDLDKQIKSNTLQIKKYMQDFKNQWIPCPQYAFLEEEEKKEKILFDIPINNLQINLEKCDYDKPDAYVSISLDFPNGKKYQEWVYINQMPKTILVPFDKEDHYNLYKKNFNLELYRTQ